MNDRAGQPQRQDAFGWREDPKLDGLIRRWGETPDLPAQKRIAEAIQLRAFDNPPFLPLRQYRQPTAYRRNLTGFMECANMLFWNVRHV